MRFKSILEKLGWVESKLERALFYLYDESGEVCGMGGPHVDDFICTGKGAKFEQCLKEMKEAVMLKAVGGRPREIWGEPNAQNLTNTAWAFAKLKMKEAAQRI